MTPSLFAPPDDENPIELIEYDATDLPTSPVRRSPRSWLSFTQLSDFLVCRHRWLLKYGYGLRPVVKAVPMQLGDAAHRGLASFLRGGTVEDGLNAWRADANKHVHISDDEWFNHAAELYQTAKALCQRTLDDFRDRGFFIAQDREGRIVEREMAMPFPAFYPGLSDSWYGWDGIHGIIDCLAYQPAQGTYWVVDWKMRASFYDDASEDTNVQNALYVALARHAGFNVVGTITYQVKAAKPTTPKLNKDGTMSRQRIACDWDTYQRALVAAGLDPRSYADEMKSKLDTEYVKPLFSYRSATQVENVLRQIVMPAAVELRREYDRIEAWDATKPRPDHLLRVMQTRVCNGCPVRPVCVGALKGYDVANLIRGGYRWRPERIEALTGIAP